MTISILRRCRLAIAATVVASCAPVAPPPPPPQGQANASNVEAFSEDLSRRTFDYFWDTTDRERWAYIFSYFPADTLYTGAQNHNFDGIGLQPNRVIEHPRFPQVYPAAA